MASTRPLPAAMTRPGSTRCSTRLGRHWELSRAHLQALSVRLHCPALHGLRDAAARAAPAPPRRHPRRTCRTAAGPLPRLWEPLASKHAPRNGYAAKFSLPYLVAVDPRERAARGSPSSRTPRCADPEVLAVTRKVTYELDSTIDYPRQFVGDVEITLNRRPVLRERQDRPRGGPDAPLSREELEAKFRGNAAALPPAAIERVIRARRCARYAARRSRISSPLSRPRGDDHAQADPRCSPSSSPSLSCRARPGPRRPSWRRRRRRARWCGTPRSRSPARRRWPSSSRRPIPASRSRCTAPAPSASSSA